MAVDVSSVQSRRALLAGAFGGLVALAARAIGQPEIVRGADVVLGGTNNTTATTTIQNTTTESTVLSLASSKTLALAATKVLATLMGNPGGTVVLKRVAVQDAADTITIILSGANANSVKVAWFVMA